MARDKGTGSIYQDARGRWRATIEAGWTASGSRRRIVITGATKTEAQTKLKAKLRQIAESGIPAPGTASMTVKRYSEAWLPRTAADLRPKTQTRNQSAVRKWIVPTVGHRRLSALTPDDVRAVTAAITGAGKSSSSAHRVNAVLMKMLKDAVADGHSVPPRVLLVKPPKSADNDREGPSVEQSMALLKTAAGDSDRSRWVAALLQGMRQGECLGLTWDAIDLAAGTIDVSWQLQDMPYEHGCDGACGRKRAGACPERRYRLPHGYAVRPLLGAWCLVRPKTAKGKRVIPLVPWMQTALAAWRDIAPESPHGLVWPDADGKPRLPADDLAAWKALQARADVTHPSGRRYHLHEARHAAATLLMKLQVPETVRIAILGHSTAAVTRAYEHADLTEVRKALEAAAGRLGLTG